MERLTNSTGNKSESKQIPNENTFLRKIQTFNLAVKKFLQSKRVPPETKEQVINRAEDAKTKAKNIRDRVALVAAILATAGTIGAEGRVWIHTPRYRITETKDSDGSVHYSHEDVETTQIIDWVTGYGPNPLTDEQKAEAIRENLHKDALTRRKPVSKEVDSMNYSQLMEVVRQRVEQDSKDFQPAIGAKKTDREFLTAFRTSLYEGTAQSYPRNPILYQKLWKLQERLGAPEIRWSDQETNLSERDKEIIRQERSQYNQEKNIIYLPRMGEHNPYLFRESLYFQKEVPNAPLAKIVSEDSHAHQYVNDSIKANLITQLDEGEVGFRAFVKGISYLTSYHKTYEEPGTIEYNAHTEIQPKLDKELGITPTGFSRHD